MPNFNRSETDPLVLWESLGRSDRKRLAGCVIRSFQSALNAQATEAEWDLRFAQIHHLRSTTGRWRNLGSSQERSALIHEEYRQEIGNLLGLVTTLREMDTPLGQALRAHQTMFISANPDAIYHFLSQQRKVLYMTPHHIQHLAKLPLTQFLYSVSDEGNKLVDLKRTPGRHDLLVLSPLRSARP